MYMVYMICSLETNKQLPVLVEAEVRLPQEGPGGPTPPDPPTPGTDPPPTGDPHTGGTWGDQLPPGVTPHPQGGHPAT